MILLFDLLLYLHNIQLRSCRNFFFCIPDENIQERGSSNKEWDFFYGAVNLHARLMKISYIHSMSFWQFACNIFVLIINSDSCC